MWQLSGPKRRLGGMYSRRDVLQVGSLALSGLTLGGVLRARASEASSPSQHIKSVILIWLRGGPSHLDSVDMKPGAPVEIRGEFQSIATNVPGVQICEYLPKVASIMDRLAIIRGIRSNDVGDHTPHYIITGSPNRGTRPAFGSVVSHLRQGQHPLPAYVSLMYEPPGLYDYEDPMHLGAAHRAFATRDEGIENMSLPQGLSLERLQDRHELLQSFDSINRRLHDDATMGGVDAFTRQALEIVASPQARDAFDLSLESPTLRARYGEFCEQFLLARRLAEAGVSVVTLRVGDWDTHEKNFRDMRAQLPHLDQGLHALVTDLYERGREKDIAVVVWGEFGRAPRISRGDGRDHWPEAGAAIVAGGGFKTGQAIGETDVHGGRAITRPYTPANVLATMYGHLGIDPALTVPDHSQRPIPLLDDAEGILELG